MEISTTQIGQAFAIPKIDLESKPVNIRTVNEDSSKSVESEAKDLFSGADIETQHVFDSNSANLDVAVSQLSEFVQNNSRNLNFSVDEGSNKQVVRITDNESGEVIRQIPTEEVLKLSERLQDLQTEVGNAVGFLFSKEV